MPKRYRVGDTEYQFPDAMSDDQVQSVLTQQGIIKSSTTAGSGKTGARLKGTPQGLPDTFMGTIANDLASLPEAAYTTLRHPIDTAAGVVKGLVNLPSDLVTDIKQGKYGKLSARALELIIPGLSSERARELATVADSAAGRAAAKISSSKVPEVAGQVIGEKVTPEIIKEIRSRLPKKSNVPPRSGPRPEPGWKSIPESPKPATTFTSQQPPMGMDEAGNLRPGPLPSGRRVGPAPNVESAPAPKSRVSLADQYGLGPTPRNPLPDVNPIQSELPSGRKVGTGEATAKPTAQPSAPSPANRLTAPASDVQKIVEFLKKAGVTPEDLKVMDETDWQLAASGAQVGQPSAETMQQVMKELESGAKKPVVMRRRKAGQ